MKKRIIVVFGIIFIALIVIFYLHKTNKNDTVELEAPNKIISDNTEEKLITIYDIEDGFLEVPYNANANKHCFDFENKLDNSKEFYKYEDDNYISKIGIDVSSHQGDIDWKKVKEAGVEFAMIRLGYRGYGSSGKLVLDTKFEQNYKGAIKEGIDVGVYFFSQSINMDELKEEAQFVLDNLKDKEIKYPVCYDLEKIKNDTARTDNLTLEEITDMTLEFCKIIKENGYKPSVYGNAKTYTTKMKLELFNDYSKWYADYQDKPLYIYDFDMWQYTEKGTVDGVSTKVDIDLELIKK